MHIVGYLRLNGAIMANFLSYPEKFYTYVWSKMNRLPIWKLTHLLASTVAYQCCSQESLGGIYIFCFQLSQKHPWTSLQSPRQQMLVDSPFITICLFLSEAKRCFCQLMSRIIQFPGESREGVLDVNSPSVVLLRSWSWIRRCLRFFLCTGGQLEHCPFIL